MEKVKGLYNLKSICNALKESPNTPNECLRVDVDCNWIANLDQIKNVHEVVDFLQSSSINECVVTPICDGEFRHHSKRATIDRRAQQQKNRHQAAECKLKISQLKQRMAKDSHQSDETIREMNKLNKDLKKYEKNTTAVVLDSFACDLSDIIMKRREDQMINDTLWNTSGGSVEDVLIAEFQADAVLAKRAIEGYSNVMVANDGDFLALIGQHCLLLKGFKFERKQGKKNRGAVRFTSIIDLSLACASKKVRDVK